MWRHMADFAAALPQQQVVLGASVFVPFVTIGMFDCYDQKVVVVSW
jgi:hypothetical protein